MSQDSQAIVGQTGMEQAEMGDGRKGTERAEMSVGRMPGMTLEKIADACGGIYFGPLEKKQEAVTGVDLDSRRIGEGYLFVATKGERADGHDFIPQVFEKGALAVISEQELTDPAGPYIRVDSSFEALKRLAAYYRTQITAKVVGITGSVGKTSTKEMIATVLSQRYRVLKTEKNFNNEIGLPLTLFRIRPEDEVAVLEMGISDFGEMERLSGMAKPDICVITNIGPCHLERLRDRDGVLRAKTECFSHLAGGGVVILNGDDDKLCTKTEVNGKAPVFYGIGKEAKRSEDGSLMAEKQVYAEEIRDLGFEGTTCQIGTAEGSFSVNISIPGAHNIYNALAAAAVGLKLGLNFEEIADGIAAAQTIAGRTNVLRVGELVVVDDCYNANPVSMKAALSVLSHAKGRTVAVLGDMGELGADERRLHYEVGEAVAREKIHTLFCAGALAEEYVHAVYEAGGDCEVFYEKDREAMTKALLDYLEPGDTVLIKASHFMEYTKVVEAIQKEEEKWTKTRS